MFDNADTLQAAINDLMSSGFDRAELSLLASEKTVDEKLGHKYRKVSELEDNAKVPSACYVSPESIGDAEGAFIGSLLYVGANAAGGAIVASGGTLAAGLAGAAIAGGVGGMMENKPVWVVKATWIEDEAEASERWETNAANRWRYFLTTPAC